MSESFTIVVRDVVCTKCGAEETHPHDSEKSLLERRLLIRGFKVGDASGYWWSQCLVCSGFYDAETLEETRDNHDGNKGWF